MKIRIIGVPIDLGADRRGVDMGPSAIRYASLQSELEDLGLVVQDLGNIEVPVPEARKVVDSRQKYLPEIDRISEKLASLVENAFLDGYIPLVLGGDHSIAIGALAGAAKVKHQLGLLWFDTHGDCNTPETTPSGNIHGMSMAVSLGFGPENLVKCGGFSPKVRPENTVLIGARNLDRRERENIMRAGIHVFTMKEIDRLGMEDVVKKALAQATHGTNGVHLSFDLDVMDPSEAPGVGTPARGGISYREAHLAMELLADSGLICSADFSEVNPILDIQNKTAEMAVGLIASVFGKRIMP